MDAFGVLNYTTYLIGVVMIILLPGPNSLYVLAIAVQYGKRAGWLGALGVFSGDLILIILTATGAATLIKAYPSIFDVVKYLGAGYLAYIGLRLIFKATKTWSDKNNQQVLQDSLTQKISNKEPYKKALLISLVNPKAILFLLSFFVQFVDPDFTHPIIPFTILAVTLQVCSFIYLAGLIFIGSQIARNFSKHRRLAAATSGTTGAVFIGFSVKLALASL